jgi:hypothetical protein
MPFFFDQTNIEGAEEAEDMIPRADQFEYMLPAPEFQGVIEPARFSIVPIEATEDGTDIAQSRPAPKGIMGLFRRLGSSADHSPARPISGVERARQAKLKREREARCMFSISVPALRAIGIKHVHCRYDGGNDEGFAWLDRLEKADGTHFPADQLGPRLREMQVYEKLCDARILARREGISTDQQAAELLNFTRETLVQEWAYLLLGTHFGTGEYVMYGAFTVDLEACTITDDPQADPIVENIQIKKATN